MWISGHLTDIRKIVIIIALTAFRAFVGTIDYKYSVKYYMCCFNDQYLPHYGI